MAELVWGQVGNRVYETGLDRGVLYLPDGSGIAWNGLTSVIEHSDKQSLPVYYEGMKIGEHLVLGSFAATMRAVTYPDEFLELEGLAGDKRGVYYGDQTPQTFALCYRTLIGNDIEGPEAGYKLHIVYNVTAVPSDKTYATASVDPNLVEFEWKISAIPEEVAGFRSTAHIIIDSREIDALLLAELEAGLYGTSSLDATLIPMPDLVNLINNFLRYEVVDHEDGTWTITTDHDELVSVDENGYFEIRFINAGYLNDYTYVAESTIGTHDVPQIRITDVGGGVWTATSDYDLLIVEGEPGLVQISNATTRVIDADTYEISDTPDS